MKTVMRVLWRFFTATLAMIGALYMFEWCMVRLQTLRGKKFTRSHAVRDSSDDFRRDFHSDYYLAETSEKSRGTQRMSTRKLPTGL